MIEAGDLLTYYSFDLGGATVELLLDRWLRRFPAHWVRAAVIEALYQGRYKAVSVDQILLLWHRRGHPIYHFNHEFERIVCNHFPRNLNRSSETPQQDDQPDDRTAASNLRLEATASSSTAEFSIKGDPPETIENEPEPLPLEPFPSENVTASLSEAAFSTPPHWAGNDSSLEEIAPFGLDLSDSFAVSRGEVAKHPIDSFVPTADEASDFYTKLKAVAHEEASERGGVATSVLRHSENTPEPPSRRASHPRGE